MFIPWKIPDPFIHLVSITEQPTGYQLTLASRNTVAICPKCNCKTMKRHSTYTRHLQDLPCVGLAVTIRLIATKWRCHTTTCPQRIFTERFSWLTPYARKTVRTTNLLRHFAFSTSCLVAAKLAKVAGLSVSHDTLLRIVYQTNVTPRAISTVIGIDEFAWCKGHTYGTIICDFVTSRIIAVLQHRQQETVSAWLKQHPHIQIVSRDGLPAFKEAIDAANPNIAQISDRWHFIKNCKKRLDDLLLSTISSSVERKHTHIEKVALPLAKYEERAMERKESKKQLIARVQTAYKDGHSMRQLAKQFQLNPRTIKKYVTAGDAWLETPRAKKVHPFHERILQLEVARMTVKKIHATLVKEGFLGAYGATRMAVEAIRKARRIQFDCEQPDLIKRPQISALLWK
ncbi:ISL3 family transposase [Metasolibacillus sp. FSL H7-0170]|uniref:ISL3 family transposase n=1 Tax=Metasolibacillus sp. FSL H7-0170 TaxID=2921431 RepID=UPI003158135F